MHALHPPRARARCEVAPIACALRRALCLAPSRIFHLIPRAPRAAAAAGPGGHRYNTVVGGERCAIVDTFWQTETGGIMITPLPGAIEVRRWRRAAYVWCVVEFHVSVCDSGGHAKHTCCAWSCMSAGGADEAGVRDAPFLRCCAGAEGRAHGRDA